MATKKKTGKKKKCPEPVKNPKLVIVFLILVALTVPWYFPKGTYEPIFFGFPYWAMISLIMSIALAVFLSWTIENRWDENEDFSDLDCF